MLVEMNKQSFDSFDDEALVMACIEPTVLQIRGKDISVKAEVVSRLNSGQQALCMFRILYPAQSSEVDYYYWMSYLLGEPGYWQGIVGGLRFFGENGMLQLLEETKELLEARNAELRLEDDHLLQAKVRHLSEAFQQSVPESIQRISAYIRSHTQDFVSIVS